MNLFYRLKEDAYVMPSVMEMRKTETGIRPLEFRVFGQVMEGEKTVVEDEIGYVKSPEFFGESNTG